MIKKTLLRVISILLLVGSFSVLHGQVDLGGLGSSQEWVHGYCDTITGEPIVIQQSDLIDDCCWKYIDGKLTKVSDGLEDCNVGLCPQEFSACVEWSSIGVFIDNTQWGCSGSGEITFLNFDGTTTVVQITNGSPGGCSNQMFDWTAVFSAAYPDAQIEPRCNLPNGCGGLLPPSSDFNPELMYFRYVNWTFCAKDKHYPIQATITAHSRASKVGKIMDLEFDQAPLRDGYICYECGDEPTLYFSDGTIVPEADKPICTFACGSDIPAPAESPCNISIEESGCDNMGTPEDLTDDVTEVIRRYVTCEDGTTTLEYYIVDPNDPQSLIDYTLVGGWSGLCDGIETPLPEIDCEYTAVVELFTTQNITGQLRNREWNLGPRQTNNQTVAFAQTVLDTFNESNATTVIGPWINLGLNDTSNDNATMDLQIVDGYIVVTEPIEVRWTGRSLGYLKVEIGECCGGLETVIEGASGDGTLNPSSSYVLPVGYHAIKMTNLDDFTNTSRTLQYSLDGGATWISDNTPPNIELSDLKPYEECKLVKECTNNGFFVSYTTGEIIDIESCYDCSLECGVQSSVVSKEILGTNDVCLEDSIELCFSEGGTDGDNGGNDPNGGPCTHYFGNYFIRINQIICSTSEEADIVSVTYTDNFGGSSVVTTPVNDSYDSQLISYSGQVDGSGDCIADSDLLLNIKIEAVYNGETYFYDYDVAVDAANFFGGGEGAIQDDFTRIVKAKEVCYLDSPNEYYSNGELITGLDAIDCPEPRVKLGSPQEVCNNGKAYYRYHYSDCTWEDVAYPEADDCCPVVFNPNCQATIAGEGEMWVLGGYGEKWTNDGYDEFAYNESGCPQSATRVLTYDVEVYIDGITTTSSVSVNVPTTPDNLLGQIVSGLNQADPNSTFSVSGTGTNAKIVWAYDDTVDNGFLIKEYFGANKCDGTDCGVWAFNDTVSGGAEDCICVGDDTNFPYGNPANGQCSNQYTVKIPLD
jgi:hypothetical protein